VIEGRCYSQPRGHIPAHLVEAVPAGADGVDLTVLRVIMLQNDVDGGGGCHKDKVTPAWTQTLNANLDPKVPFDTLKLHS